MTNKWPTRRSFLAHFTLGLVLGALFCVGTLRAQLAPPNAAGVSMGHLHLNVSDIEASKKFYLEIGGVPVKMGPTVGVEYPGAIFWLRKAEPSGGMEGTTVNHFGFLVKDGAALLAKMKDEGVKTVPNPSGHGGFLFSPDGAKIEILEKTDLAVPAQFDQIHFFVADPAPDGGASWSELQAWYNKFFGAMTTKSGKGEFGESSVPGVNLRFSKADTATVGTKGTALDHIGFEVKNLEAFCKQLQANGIKLDRPYGVLPALGISYAFLTDPWGTYIELNEGLDKAVKADQ